MPVPPSDEMIEQFLAGNLEPEHAREVREYLNATPGGRGVMAGIQASIRGEFLAPPPALEAALARFHALIDRVDDDGRDEASFRRPSDIRPVRFGTSWPAPGGSPAFFSVSPVRRAVALIGACVILCASLVGVWMSTATRTASSSVATKLYRTANAQRATVLLPDGSTVILGPASTLSVSSDFRAQRDVAVQGEGYFSVRTDATRPFLVHSGNTVVRVLGTTFSVRHYAADTHLRVAVVEGRVAVRPLDQPANPGAVVAGGTLATMDSAGTIDVTSQANVDDYTAWTKGQLIFRSTPLRDVLAEIERQYDLTLQFADTTQLQKRFSAQFSDEPVGQVLDAVALAFHAQYTRSGPNGRIVKFVAASQQVQRAVPVRLPHSSTQDIQYGR